MSLTITHLEAEHSEVRALLDAFDAHLADMSSDERADIREASALLEYMSDIFFVKHEEKEETILLPELYRERKLADLDELRRLREQHHRGHRLLDELWKALRLGEERNEEQRNAFLVQGKAWLRFIRGHFRLEEEYVFPRLAELISEELDLRLLSEFESIERDFRSVPDAQPLRKAAERFASNALQRRANADFATRLTVDAGLARKWTLRCS